MKIYPQHHDTSFYPLLVSFCLQITYRKMRNLQIHVNKLVGKVSINLLYHAKIIASCKVSNLCDQQNCLCIYYSSAVEVVRTPKQTDLASFLL